MVVNSGAAADTAYRFITCPSGLYIQYSQSLSHPPLLSSPFPSLLSSPANYKFNFIFVCIIKKVNTNLQALLCNKFPHQGDIAIYIVSFYISLCHYVPIFGEGDFSRAAVKVIKASHIFYYSHLNSDRRNKNPTVIVLAKSNSKIIVHPHFFLIFLFWTLVLFVSLILSAKILDIPATCIL